MKQELKDKIRQKAEEGKGMIGGTIGKFMLHGMMMVMGDISRQM